MVPSGCHVPEFGSGRRSISPVQPTRVCFHGESGDARYENESKSADVPGRGLSSCCYISRSLCCDSTADTYPSAIGPISDLVRDAERGADDVTTQWQRRKGCARVE